MVSLKKPSRYSAFGGSAGKKVLDGQRARGGDSKAENRLKRELERKKNLERQIKLRLKKHRDKLLTLSEEELQVLVLQQIREKKWTMEALNLVNFYLAVLQGTQQLGSMAIPVWNYIGAMDMSDIGLPLGVLDSVRLDKMRELENTLEEINENRLEMRHENQLTMVLKKELRLERLELKKDLELENRLEQQLQNRRKNDFEHSQVAEHFRRYDLNAQQRADIEYRYQHTPRPSPLR